MKKIIILAALAALAGLMPLGSAVAGDHRYDRDRSHHHHDHDAHGYDRGRYYPPPYYYRPPPPPPPSVYYYYYAPPPRPPGAIIYRDYGYGPSLNLELQLRDRR